MIKSELYRGLIYAGNTQLESSLVFAQTGPLQVTISAGHYKATDGSLFTFDGPLTLDFEPGAHYRVEFGILNGEIETLVLENWPNYPEIDYPDGWIALQVLILPFIVPAEVIELPDVFVLSVLPGFPEGTTAADWKMQIGSVK